MSRLMERAKITGTGQIIWPLLCIFPLVPIMIFKAKHITICTRVTCGCILSTANIMILAVIIQHWGEWASWKNCFHKFSLLLFIFLEVGNKPICYTLGQWGEEQTNQKGRPSAPWPFWLFLAGFQVGRRQLFDSCLLSTSTGGHLATALHRILGEEFS